jgi:V/A-type H+/Na+-transporting ATPase subunit E
MHNKLQELTDKIYHEGISQANEEAAKILAEAKTESKRIIEDSQKKAENIIAVAEKKAEEILKNSTSELKISFRHALNTLKQDLEKTISAGIISDKVSKAVSDDNFIAELILAIYKNWKPETGNVPVEVLLPAGTAERIEKRLRSEISKELKSGLILKPSSKIKTGFEIIPSGSSFKISATGEDLEAYLKEFIRPKLAEILFQES